MATTYVLIHGAYQGGWIWKPVAARLRAAGHVVHAPTLDGCAERHHLVRPGINVGMHAQEVAQLLFYEDLQQVVLVGTSSGGMVVCKAAELARERIARVVFVDALALLAGERVDKIVNRTAPNETSDLTTGPTRADAADQLLGTGVGRHRDSLPSRHEPSRNAPAPHGRPAESDLARDGHRPLSNAEPARGPHAPAFDLAGCPSVSYQVDRSARFTVAIRRSSRL